jgi:hypothetical protein
LSKKFFNKFDMHHGGLTNHLGFECYYNSSLQVLNAVKPFRQQVLAMPGRISAEIQNCFNLMNAGATSSSHDVQICVTEETGLFGNETQEDVEVK